MFEAFVSFAQGSFGAAFVIIFALSVIIFIHEYGHYSVGRLCGIHADVFSLGFGRSLFRYRAKNGTIWQISAIPLGGYVKFRGDKNAASLGVKGGNIPEKGSFDAAPLWARTLTVLAGPVFNFMLSIALFTGLYAGQHQFQDTAIIGKIYALPYNHPLKIGDEITAIDGFRVADMGGLSQAARAVSDKPVVQYQYLRAQQQRHGDGPHPFAPIVQSVSLQSAALDAGLREGDVITHVNDEPIHSFSQLQKRVQQLADIQIKLRIWRAGDVLHKTLQPRVVDFPNADGSFNKRVLIGITGGMFFEPLRDPIAVGFGQAFLAAIDQTAFIIWASLNAMGKMIAGSISVCNLSGPVTLAQTTTQAAAQGTSNYIAFIAFVSAAIGLMNLFPIPVLDGGHLVFFAYEFISGRKAGPKLFQALMMLGLMALGAIMLLAISTDFLC